MKIAQVNSYFYPFMIGGAEWYVYNISKELIKRGDEVTVFTADRYGNESAPRDEVVEGIRVRRFPLKLDLSYRMKLWDGLSGALEEGSFDVIHTYDYAQKHTLDALNAARSSGAGSALTIFDVHSSIPRSWYKQIPMRYLDGYFARRAFPLATRILVRAPDLVKGLPEIEHWESKVRVSPSGVRPESFQTFDGQEFRRRYKIAGSPLVLFLGRLNPLKGPQYIVEAAPTLVKDFPDIAFAFVGPDQSGYRSHLEARAKELGVSDRVHFTGMISDFQEKMEAYSACDLFCLPTSYEGTSQAIFEAMTQGKPVVATRTGGIPYQIEDGKSGYLVEHGDVRGLAEAMASAIRDSSKAKELGERGRSKVADFQYPALAEGLHSVYEEIVETVGN
ncbi:MAG TPA: glycosyltransferase family 4 protein [Nitrososphaerales archaeon]|nr:glycosyltransferase family 4 protein [Nitrososphaerales archaeon]